MAVVPWRRVVVIVDVRTDAVDERGQKRIQAFAPSQRLRRRGPGKRPERPQRDVDGWMRAAANRTADDVDDGAERLVTNIGWHVLEPLRDQPGGESLRGSRFQGSRFKVLVHVPGSGSRFMVQ